MSTGLRDHKAELAASLQEAAALLGRNGMIDEANRLQSVVMPSLERYRPSLMFYGVYNAGKSSLLNAIIGEDRAPVGDVPTTREVTTYTWQSYDIVDTPGINGPEKDYTISLAELEKHDISLFVIADSDDFDGRRVANEVLRIIGRNKPLVIVLNNKQVLGSSEENQQRAVKIKEKLYENLRAAADRAGFAQVEKRYDFLQVNAAAARLGQQTGNLALVERSAIGDLKALILSRLQELTGPKQLIAPADMIIQRLESLRSSLIKRLATPSQQAGLEQLNDLAEAKNTLYRSVQSGIRREIYRAGEEIRQLALGGQDPTDRVNALQEQLNRLIEEEIRRTLADLRVSAEVRIGRRSAQMGAMPKATPAAEGERPVPTSEESGSTADVSGVAATASGLLAMIRPPMPIPGPLPIPIPVIIWAVKKLIEVFSNSRKQQEQIEDLKRHVAEARSRAQEDINRRIAMMQEVSSQIRVKLNQLEEEVLKAVDVCICEALQGTEQQLRQQLAEAGTQEAALAADAEACNELLAGLQRLKAVV